MTVDAPIAPEVAGPFMRAVEETFEKMLACAVSAGRVAEREAPSPRDISAVVGFTGGRRGAVVLSLGEHTACRIVSRFAGEPVEETGPVVYDGVGEILNIIAGRAKTALSKETSSIDMSLPTIVRGREHEVHKHKDAPTLLLPFSSELGEFELVLILERPAAKTLRVLVADDSRVMRKLVRAALRDVGPVDVVEVENGARAREALSVSGNRFDLVLLDLHMPEVHGRDVLLDLRRRPGGDKVPVVVITSDPDVERIVDEVVTMTGGRELTRWLAKPFTPVDLIHVVKAVRGAVKP
ncbi:MAG TPA: chemotaxis protein CheX [Planctomycetota bacterium]|nr:chemotaxis protein CheX [Planctomycetota bacterium]